MYANSYGTEIRFPFREVDNQHKSCGYPGFDVRCNNGGKPTLELLNSITFEIDSINYDDQYVDLSDPDGCLPLKLISLNLSTSQFYALYFKEFAVFNCSGQFDDWEYNNTSNYDLNKVNCLSGMSYTVYAVESLGVVSLLSSTCQWVANVSVPDYYGISFSAIYEDELMNPKITLRWDEPSCRQCETLNRRCRVKKDSTDEIECTSMFYSTSSGVLDSELHSKAFILSLGIGLPVCLVAAFSLLRWFQQRNNESPTDTTMRARSHTTIGISQSVLDSYPTVVISEGCQLITPENNTCSICLSEYKINEVLKISPHCLHRFHVDCVDQWLVLDGTCPICRVVPSQSLS
ncbi:putative RING-H2 finger protein ATL21A [Chenopodium quinoa]|uniref:putative RING-H2 finger protein ATL21A n=1 Tax=Chenopodium quinoa TaxID=63459 RepID=UPI000B797A2F|nr:putative RING-H2 finger protein ATL21A [Chenopodium quinoa]